MFNDTLAAIGLGPFLADDEWFLGVATPTTQRVRQSVQRVTDLLPALFNLDVVLSRHNRREVNPNAGVTKVATDSIGDRHCRAHGDAPPEFKSG
jgi:hypothetical protein